MRVVDLILKKRNGEILSTKEIEFLVSGYTNGVIPDYQISALTMAIFFQGMNKRETADLTMAMVRSGEQINLEKIEGVKVDKHSTGGVGDTTTLVLAPLVAACGVPVAKMSGHGLGHTGGTLDKLASIPGFQINLTETEFIHNVNQIGVAVISQSGNLVPADKALYGLRDVTATVESIPLIASSIMSKKLAAGADAILLDVKMGSGAFLQSQEDAMQLAREMVDIGNNLGRKTIAVLTNMDQPLGCAVGNALEVKEAVAILQNSGPEDLRELCLALGSQMLILAKKVATPKEGREMLEDAINNGSAFEKLQALVSAQSGNPRALDDLDLLPTAQQIVPIKAETAGYVQRIEALDVGISAMLLGAGREKKESVIDLAVGVVIEKKVGDPVKIGDTLAELHVNQTEGLAEALDLLKKAFTTGLEKPQVKPLIYQIIK